MNKNEFLQRLKDDLSALSDVERQNAMKYYEEYFAEANDEREEEITEEFVSPEYLAHKIEMELDEIAAKIESSDNILVLEEPEKEEIPEMVFQIKTDEPKRDKEYKNEKKEEENTQWQYQKNIYNQYQKKQNNTWKIVLLICTFPIWLPLLISLASVAFGVFMTVFGIIFSVAALAVAGFIMAGAGFMSVGYGIFSLFTDTVNAIYPIGAGFVVSGLGIIMACLFTKLTAVMFKSQIKAASWTIRGITGRFARKGV